jgi:hypothetical protein
MESLVPDWLSLCVSGSVAQAPLEHGFSFDLLSLFEDLLGPPEGDVGGRQITEALMVALRVVVLDEDAGKWVWPSRMTAIEEKSACQEGLLDFSL